MKIKTHRPIIAVLLMAVLHGCTSIPDDKAITTTKAATLNLTEFTADEVLPLLKSGEVSVESYMTALLAQTEKHADRLNAFITLEPEKVLAAARAADAKRERGEELGPLFGIPISFKDLISTKDLVTTFGTKKFAGFT